MTDRRFEKPIPATLAEHAEAWRDMVPHLGHLRALAAEAHSIVELGVRAGVSTWALLDGLPPDGTMTSVDVLRNPLPERVTSDPRWTFVEGDDLTVDLPPADLVFIDTTHGYRRTYAELDLARDLGARVIALHDWATDGVRLAVLRWMTREWDLAIHESEWGLAVLTRSETTMLQPEGETR